MVPSWPFAARPLALAVLLVALPALHGLTLLLAALTRRQPLPHDAPLPYTTPLIVLQAALAALSLSAGALLLTEREAWVWLALVVEGVLWGIHAVTLKAWFQLNRRGFQTVSFVVTAIAIAILTLIVQNSRPTVGEALFYAVAALNVVVLFIAVCLVPPRETVSYGVLYHRLLNPTDDRQIDNPERNLSLFSILSFSWMNNLLALGYARPLSIPDLFPLIDEDTAIVISDKFREAYQSHGSSVFKGLLYGFGKPFFLAAIFKFIQDSLSFVGPVILNLTIHFLQTDKDIQIGLLYCLILFLAAIIQSLSLHQYFHRCFRSGMRLRAAIVTSVYQKSLRLTPSARMDKTSGDIVNLMSVDAQRLQDLLPYLHMIWSAPFQITISLVLLWQQIGISSLAGLAIMILLIPINTITSKAMRRQQQKLMQIKDERIRITNEVFTNIKIIKMYAWEISFSKVVQAIREKEVKTLRCYVLYYAGQTVFWTASPLLIALAAFTCFSLLGGDLTAAKAFTTLSLFNVLRFPISILPNVVNNILEASVSVDRLQSFLDAPEICDDRSRRNGNQDWDLVDVAIDSASFSWDDNGDIPALKNINLHINRGDFCVIVGRTGSGKTALLRGILSEITKLRGEVFVGGSIAYTSQIPWIQNATIKDNILFGNQYDEDRLREVLNSCSMIADLRALKGGLFAEIGERGINISGGQKHRVALARAVYADKEIYLLDDPLSAVDAHVGRDIVRKCINGMLKDKTRILVTNSLNVLPFADQIVLIQDGMIAAKGTYEDLQELPEFLEFVSQEEADEKEVNKEQETEYIMDDIKADEDISFVQEAESGKLMDAEFREIGDVSWKIYLEYTKRLGGVCVVLIVFLSMLGSMGSELATSRWLAYWSDNREKHSSLWFLARYSAFSVSVSVFLIIAVIIFSLSTVRAARTLHDSLIDVLFKKKMTFYDITPMGRILNRLTKDQYIIDEKLCWAIFSYLRTVFRVSGIFIMISWVTPLFLVVMLPLSIVYIRIQKYYISSSRELKRLDSIQRSPIFSHFSETLDGEGVSVIRSFDRSKEFCMRNEYLTDNSMEAYYPSIASNRWLALRLEFLGNCIIMSASLLAVLYRGSINPSLGGLAISYALSVTQYLNWMVRMTSERETNIVSVERNREFSEPVMLEGEHDPEQMGVIVVPEADWPQVGVILLENVEMRYREGLDLVLKGISCQIGPHERIGCVGRTGAGKSSLLLALLRIVEVESGSIVIDGINTKNLSLFDLRSRISIIPQDPVLFTGTIRFNLDPFSIYSDSDIMRCVELVQMGDYIHRLDQGLSYDVSEGGTNFSVGQRQLLCFARALLRNSPVILMDEATSSVSVDIGLKIQHAIREVFSDRTLVIVAHRLDTVLDCDRVIVMDDGKIGEIGNPQVLLDDPSSRFSALIKSVKID